MNAKKTEAEKAIMESGILVGLQGYSPAVVSTIFVGLDTSDSDIDVVCSYQSQHAFASDFESSFEGLVKYDLRLAPDYAMGQFVRNGFLFEVYASTIPTYEQPGYRHFYVMKRLVTLGGKGFRKQIRALKAQGLKTEPAIARVLALKGNPYEAVLDLENWPGKELKARMQRFT